MDQGRQERHQVDATVMLLVRRQHRPASAPCAGLQSHKLHADAGSAGGSQAMVDDEPAGKTREDRRQSGTPWPLRGLPDGRGRGAEGIVPGNLAANRRTATKTGPSIGLGRSDESSRREECVEMTRKRAKSMDQTSIGTTETPGALRSLTVASGCPRRMLSSTPLQSSSAECRF